MKALRGYRTYILAGAAILLIAARLHAGKIDAEAAIEQALVALGLVTARVGAKNDAV